MVKSLYSYSDMLMWKRGTYTEFFYPELSNPLFSAAARKEIQEQSDKDFYITAFSHLLSDY